MSDTFMNDEKYKFNNGPFKEVWDNIYKTETFEDIPKLSKDSKKREVRSRKEFIAKFILFSVIIGQVAIAKEIGGMVVQNKIQKGNLPSQYLIEQSHEETIRELIDEEIIRAYDCMEESMSNAEISLNPTPEYRREDGSAYHRPIRKKAQILERVRKVPIEITTSAIQWCTNVGWCGGEFAIENYMHADIETLQCNIFPSEVNVMKQVLMAPLQSQRQNMEVLKL